MNVANEIRGVKEGCVFGSRQVIGCPFSIGRDKHKRIWCAVVRCRCGRVGVVRIGNLLSGKSERCKSCHFSAVNTTHGATARTGKRHALYLCWQSMRNRCQSSTNDAYENYGARGICVCQEWDERYESFRDWALANGWKPGLTIDRIDNDGNYEPGNCQWLTKPENTAKRWRDEKAKAVA